MMRARFVDGDGASFFADVDETLDVWMQLDPVARDPAYTYEFVESVAKDAEWEGRLDDATAIRQEHLAWKKQPCLREIWRLPASWHGPLASPIRYDGEWCDLVYRYAGT
jgi:hypothetical protein